jgi:hypothetical protein
MLSHHFDTATAIGLIQNIEAELVSLKMLVSGKAASSDPADPANKLPDGKLSSKGVDVCYDLFDQGKSRYAVGQLMSISFGAATHRWHAWKAARPKKS